MDKNTIYGLLLMAAIFFGFMWLQPKQNNEAADNKKTEQQASEQSAPAVTPLSDDDRQWLAENIAANGTTRILPDSSRVTTIDDGGLNLTLKADSIYGTVEVGGRQISYADIAARNLNKMSPAEYRAAVDLLRNKSAQIGRYGKFAQFLAGKDSTLTLQNDVLLLSLSTKGAAPSMAMLKKYDTEYSPNETEKRREKVVIFKDSTNSLAFTLPLPQEISSRDLFFTPHAVGDSAVLFKLEFSPNAWWGIEYSLPKGESYMVKIRILQSGMAAIAQSNIRNLTVDWHQDIKRQEKGRMFEERNSALYYKFARGSVENLSESKNDTEERQAKVRWIAFKNQFFSSVLISQRPFNTADFQSEVLKGSDYLKSLTAKGVVNDYDWSASNPASFEWFIGPNLYPLLSDIDKQTAVDEDLSLTRLVPLGWSLFRWINTGIIIPIFTLLGSWISNYGIIILILTIFIKLVLFPLTYKSYKSQAVMRVLAPDIKAINEKYPGQENAMTRQQKTMALYSKAGANPMSGCLPMLLQMPILFAMFSFFPSCIELRGESFLWVHDLSAPDAIISWSGNIPLVTEYFGNHISLFCLLMTIVNIVYTYINMQNQPGGGMPGMKWMMYLMPVFFMIFFNNYAAGLSYYYFLSLLITIIQTYAFRYVIKEEDVRKKMAENAKKPKKKSGFMARLEQMQKEQQAMLREQQKQRGKR